MTLQVRDEHGRVTEGVNRRVRNAMHTALLLFSLGQAIAVPNWVEGPPTSS